MHRTIERIHVGEKYGDIPRGIFLIRGENMVLCGEVRDEDRPPAPVGGHLVRVEVEEILELQHQLLTAKQEEERLRRKALIDIGFTPASVDADREDY